jgi:hypothetical protein
MKEHNFVYAGIGARVTPQRVLYQMEKFARAAEFEGGLLRSGGAKKGADHWFERGVKRDENKQIFHHYEKIPEAWYDHAALYHPKWELCDDFARAAHARNSAVMLGADLCKPVLFVVCFTLGGRVIGGTGQALRIANDLGIPVFNFFDKSYHEIVKAVKELIDAETKSNSRD